MIIVDFYKQIRDIILDFKMTSSCEELLFLIYYQN